MNEPGLSVVKTLFALSRNICYYRGCEEILTKPGWLQVNADVAHIVGEKPGAARYDRMVDLAGKLHDFENLMLLRPKHHRLVDRLEPHNHSVALLKEMKATHESRFEGKNWATEVEPLRLASLLLDSESGETVAVGTPRLALRR